MASPSLQLYASLHIQSSLLRLGWRLWGAVARQQTSSLFCLSQRASATLSKVSCMCYVSGKYFFDTERLIEIRVMCGLKLPNYVPAKTNVSTSFLISSSVIPSPFSSLAVRRMSKKSRCRLASCAGSFS